MGTKYLGELEFVPVNVSPEVTLPDLVNSSTTCNLLMMFLTKMALLQVSCLTVGWRAVLAWQGTEMVPSCVRALESWGVLWPGQLGGPCGWMGLVGKRRLNLMLLLHEWTSKLATKTENGLIPQAYLKCSLDSYRETCFQMMLDASSCGCYLAPWLVPLIGLGHVLCVHSWLTLLRREGLC